MDWIVTEGEPERSLEEDLQSFKKLFGGEVQLTQLSDLWRLRLKLPWDGLQQGACCAWGISNDPLNLEFSLPTKGYSFETLKVKRVWQENFPKFALEAQLRHILQDFLEICRDGSWKLWSDLDEAVDEEANRVYYERKKKRLMLNALEEKQNGLLVCLARYLQLRVPTVHEYCAICDKAFDLPPMMMRTVCSQELCTYQFAEFGSKITTAETVNHPSEILDLLVCMLSAAALSSRRNDILEPYPLVQLAGDSTVLHPQQKDFFKVEETEKL